MSRAWVVVYTDTSRFGTDVLNVNPELKVVDSPMTKRSG